MADPSAAVMCPVCGLVARGAADPDRCGPGATGSGSTGGSRAGRSSGGDRPGRPAARGGAICPNRWCRRSDRGFSVVFSIGRHEGDLRRAISRYKYRGERRLAGVFAESMVTYLEGHATWFEEFDLVTAVPSYLGPGARRSWDPTGTVLDLLATRLGAAWQVAAGVLRKTAETPAMAGLGWVRRQEVAQGPLRASLRVATPELVQGAQVLVVDDVLTDGSTLREVALKLRAAGASDVAGLVLARPTWSAAAGGRR